MDPLDAGDPPQPLVARSVESRGASMRTLSPRRTGRVDRYADVPLGGTDASLVVLAERHSLRRIATLDRRHTDVSVDLMYHG